MYIALRMQQNIKHRLSRLSNILILVLISIGILYSLLRYDPQHKVLQIADHILEEPDALMWNERSIKAHENQLGFMNTSARWIDSIRFVLLSDPNDSYAQFAFSQLSIQHKDYNQAIQSLRVCVQEEAFEWFDVAQLQLAALHIKLDHLKKARIHLVQLQAKTRTIATLQDQLLSYVEELI